ncbi:dsRNA binding Pkr inhibitor [Cetacean poxvirus 1]|nr:dsRNA binding Pkr inhibitor [Cetacean poxvirus 1]
MTSPLTYTEDAIRCNIEALRTPLYYDNFECPITDTINYIKVLEWQNKNPVSVLNEYCQTTGRKWIIHIVKYGSDHCPLFLGAVIIDGHMFPYDCGKTKKEARCAAATLAVHKLHLGMTITYNNKYY